MYSIQLSLLSVTTVRRQFRAWSALEDTFQYSSYMVVVAAVVGKSNTQIQLSATNEAERQDESVITVNDDARLPKL